jgi:hypothetical protein
MAETNDPVARLIEMLHDLRLSDVEGMSDGVLKVVNEPMLNWHELISQEEDKRAMARGKG